MTLKQAFQKREKMKKKGVIFLVRKNPDKILGGVSHDIYNSKEKNREN